MKKIIIVFVLITIQLLLVSICYAEEEKELDFFIKTEYTDLIEKEECIAPSVIYNNTPIKLNIESNKKSEYKIILDYIINDKLVSVGFNYDKNRKNTKFDNISGWFNWIEKSDLYLPEVEFPSELNMLPAKITLVDCNDSSRKVTKNVILVNTENWELYTVKFNYLENSFDSKAVLEEYSRELLIPKFNPKLEQSSIKKLEQFSEYVGVEVTKETVSIQDIKSKDEFIQIMKTSIYTFNEEVLQKYFGSDLATLGITTLQCANIINGYNSLFKFVDNAATALTVIDFSINFAIYCDSLASYDLNEIIFFELSNSEDYELTVKRLSDGKMELLMDDFNMKWNGSKIQQQYKNYVLSGENIIKEDVQKKITFINHFYYSSTQYKTNLERAKNATKALIDMQQDSFMILTGKSVF